MISSDKKRLLVVDDEKAIRHLLMRIAQRAGFDVESAADGIEALEMMQQHHYDIAIVDLMMPRLSGYELVQKMTALKRRPIVLVATAMASTDVASLDDSMVRRIIRKPFDIAAVAAALIETAKEIVEDPASPPVVELSPADLTKAVAEILPEPPAMAAAPPRSEVVMEDPKPDITMEDKSPGE